MSLPLFSKVILKEDIPELKVKKGSVATIVEHYPTLGSGEDGYSLEGLIEQDTVEVSASQIESYCVKNTSIHEESTLRR